MRPGAGRKLEWGRLPIAELLAGERTALQQIAQGSPLPVVLETLTRTIDGQLPGLSCSILLLEGKRLRLGAAPGLPEAYSRAIDGIAIGPRAASCGTAAYRAEAVLAADIASDPLWAEYRHLAIPYGLRACWSTPIFGSEGSVLGTFAIYFRQARGPRPPETEAVEFVTRTAAIAIERKRNEDERARLLARERAARERTAKILASIADGLIEVDGEFRFTYANPSAEALMARRLEDLAGHTLWGVFPAIAGTSAEKACRRAVKERVAVQFDLRYAPARRWFEVNGYPSEDGGLSIYFRDITERKEHEETLRNEQKWLEAVVDLMPTPMLLIEPGTARVTFANHAANDAVGGHFPRDVPLDEYDTGYFCTNSEGRRIPADEMPGVRLARGERLEGFQMNWKTPAGERTVLVFGDTLPAMYGHPAIAVCLFQDITHLKHAEQAVRRAQKLESLGVLAGGVAHDFNNLLTGIMGNASLLADACEDPEHREMARDILESSERAADLTRQLLAYSGRGRFVMEDVNLSKLAAEVVELLPRSLARGVRLEARLDGELPDVWADAAQMRQLITNLLLNGAEAIGAERGGTVAVRTGVETVEPGTRMVYTSGEVGPGRYVALEVEDDGCGMDAETQARIFDPFFTTKFAGRGLGLAAVLGIVRGHQGAIRVESRPDEGTRVKVLLPCALAAVAHGDAGQGAGDGE